MGKSHLVKRGSTPLLIRGGSYEDHFTHGPFEVLEQFDYLEMWEKYKTIHPDEFNFEIGSKFAKYLCQCRLIRPLKHYIIQLREVNELYDEEIVCFTE